MFDINSKVNITEMADVLATLQSINDTMDNFLVLGFIFLIYKIGKDVFSELTK